MTAASWFDDARAVSAEAVAEGLALEIKGKGSTRGFTCPMCNQDHSDKRPSGRLVHRGAGWRCWRCEKGGDGLKLAALVLVGAADGDGRWGEVRAWYAAQGWCDPDPRTVGDVAKIERRPPPKVKPEPPPKRLPADEVAALWDSGWPVFTESRAHRWCMARGLEPWRVAGMDVARSLAPHGHDYRWARSGGVPWRDGHTLLLPCYDATGALVGLRARWTGADAAEDGAGWVEAPCDGGKEVSPRGAGALRGSLYADLVGRWVLANGPAAMKGGRPDPEAPGLRWDGRIMIVEGGPAWMQIASADGRVKMVGDVGWTPAVFGVWSGAWPDDEAGAGLAGRMVGAEAAVIATDDDKAGDRYAHVISSALRAVGVSVMRANKDGG